MIKSALNEKQRRLEDFSKPIYKKIYREFDYLIAEYKKAYNTDKFDRYDLYDFTWEVHGSLKIKNMPRCAFFSSFLIYQKTKAKYSKTYIKNTAHN
jgi:hypothetical protein